MPLYEYRCKKCEEVFEKIRKFSDRPLIKCPKCGGRLERLPSAPAFQFKGSGWYVTDYARKSSATDTAKSETSSQSKDTKKTEPAGTPSKEAETSKTKESPSAKPSTDK